MANVDFRRIGRESAQDKLSEDAALSKARIAANRELTDSERASLSEGYISGMKNSKKPGGWGETVGESTSAGFSELARIKGTSFGGKEAMGIPEAISGVGDLMAAYKLKGWEGLAKEGLGKVIDQVTEVYRQETELRNNINKGLGVTGKLGDDIRDAIMSSAAYGQKFAVSISDANDAFQNLGSATGRFATVSDVILKQGFVTARAFLPTIGDLGTTFAQFERIGVGYSDTLTQLNDIAKQSMVIGLNGQKTIQDVRDNIEKINRYNFKNGTEGLAQMSRIAKIFRTDMQDAFNVAEKVMDPEGAVEMSAKLQALGGNIGEFNDVYKLMYDSVNDPEAIQKALISMSSGLASYNEQAGKFQITGLGVRMLSEQAKITGADYKNLAAGAIAAQEKMRGLQQLASNSFLNVKGEDKDFLLNLAHMEHGEMKITIPPDMQDKFAKLGGAIEKELKDTGMISFRNMNQEAFARFEAYQDEFKDAFPEDIARGQYTLIQNISNDVSALASFGRATAVKGAGGTLRGLGLEKGVEYAAKLLDINVSRLTKVAGSNDATSNNMKSRTQKVLDLVSLGLTEQARAKFTELETELAKKERQFLKEQNGTPGKIRTTSLVEETLGTRAGSTSSSNTSTVNVKYEFAWQPNNMVNELQRQAIKDPEVAKNLMPQVSKKSYTGLINHH